MAKRKGTGPSGVSKVSKKTPSKTPAKKKKSTAAKKKTTRRKTKKTSKTVELSHSLEGLTSDIDKGMNVPSGGL